MATISTSGIESGRIIRSAHVLRIIEALDGTETNDIYISGSLITTGSVGITGSVDVIGNVTGSAFTGSFIGDGSGLTGVTGEWDGTHNGNAEITGSFNVSGSTGLTGSLEVSGSVILSGSFSGSFEGDGTNLTGITAEWDGTHDGNAQITGSLFISGTKVDLTEVTDGVSGSFSGSFVGDGSGITGVTGEWDGSLDGDAQITGSLFISGTQVDLTEVTDGVSGSFSGSFEGDGSGLTGITGEWDGSLDGNAQITGSLEVSGSTKLTGSLNISPSPGGIGPFGALNIANSSGYELVFSGSYNTNILHSGDNSFYVGNTSNTTLLHLTASTVEVNGSVSSSVGFSGSFEGDGSGLTNLPSSTTFPYDGVAEITGSIQMSGSAFLSGTLDFSGSQANGYRLSLDGTSFHLNKSGSLGGGQNTYSTTIHHNGNYTWWKSDGSILMNLSGNKALEVQGNIDTTLGGITQNSITSSFFTGSFLGDGSGLTNLPSSTTFPYVGVAEITGSIQMSGSAFLSGTLDFSGSQADEYRLSMEGNHFYLNRSGSLGGGTNTYSTTIYHNGASTQWKSDGSVFMDLNGNKSFVVQGNIDTTWEGIVENSITSSFFTGSFIGDGSGLTGIVGEWDGTLDGNAEITGSLIVSGSDIDVIVTGSVHVTEVLSLAPMDPLPTDYPTGSLASSGSAGSVKPYFWDGTTWNALY